MKKTIIACVVLALVSVPAMASAQNVGACGWGSKLFAGQKGIVPQSLAVTTNGTSGNQTFAITSGTSGCTPDGVVRSNWKTAAYIDGNMNRFARDLSRGEGESLETLATLLEVAPEHRAAFRNTLKSNFAAIFPSAEANTADVVNGIRETLAQSSALSQYAARV